MYTIGERHGFTITEKTDHDNRLFVVSKDVKQNTITVAERQSVLEGSDSKDIALRDVHWTLGTEVDMNKSYSVRFRYRQTKVTSDIIKKDGVYYIKPIDPQFDIAGGQTAVIYDEDVCVGAGIVM